MVALLGSKRQESNGFSSMLTDESTFKDTYLLHGDHNLAQIFGSRTGEGDFANVLKREDKTMIPSNIVINGVKYVVGVQEI